MPTQTPEPDVRALSQGSLRDLINKPNRPTGQANGNWQQGLDPNQLAMLFGTDTTHNVAFDPNRKGSWEANYNQQLSNFTPDQLLARYGTGKFTNVGSQMDKAQQSAYNSFKQVIGREPSSSEFAQILPAFQQSVSFGNAQLGAMKDRLAQDPNDPLNKSKVGQYKDQISQLFKTRLGRDATPDEINHFGALMATGNTDAYGIDSFLQGSSEYQGQQNQQFQQGLGKQLNDTDVDYFNRAKQGVMSQFMQNGTGNSSALDSALTDLMGQIHAQDRQYLAGVSAQQYGGNQQLALGNYQNQLNQYLGNQNYNRGNAQNQANYFTGRSDNMADYARQKSDYENYMSGQQGNRPGIGGAVGSIVGGGLGAYLGGPTGAQAGMGIGQGAGNLFSYLGGK